MLSRLGRLIIRRRGTVLVAALLFLGVAGAFGGGVVQHLSTGGFDDPASESSRAAATLDDVFHQGNPNLVLLVTAKQGSVDSAAVAAAGAALTRQLAAEPGVERASSYWSMGSPASLRSVDGRQALVLASLTGSADGQHRAVERIAARYQGSDGDGAVSVAVGGGAEIGREVGDQVTKDLSAAESLAFPITLVLLVVAFATVTAGVLPLAIGGLAIMGTFLALRLIAAVTDVSVFALNLATALGLGLAIDYSLFIVSRYREELAGGAQPHDAVARTIQTAGRTVLFSAATVAISLAALLVFPLYFLRSFGYAGIAVVAVAATGAVVVLPALLVLLGRRVEWLPVRRRRAPATGTGWWHRIATAVMRRPLPVATSIVALLLLLGAPFLGVHFGLPDDRVLPAGAPARQATNQIREHFAANEAAALSVVATGIGDPARRAPEIDRYAAALSRLPGVAGVETLTGAYAGGRQVAPPGPASRRFAAADGVFLSVGGSVEPLSGRGEQLVHDVRALPAPFAVRVGGQSAALVDTKASLFGRMPLALGLIALVTFTLLFLMSGSVVIPLKALLLNLLSLTATFGAMVWVFQQGHLASLLGFTATGTIDTTMPMLMFCVTFGLSMDYEVFLLSRIKEEHDRGADTTTAVALGLERTGRIVTTAAALLAIVFIAFATSKVSFIKLLGVGAALAVLMDATLVRALLVPAFMRLAGRANWWAPAPLRRLHGRFGIREAGAEAQPIPVSGGA